MTTVQMATYFDILQDKYGAPYFTNSEKSLLFNRAQIIFVKEMLPTDKDVDLSIETNQDTLAIISPLIIPLTPITNPINGSVPKSIIQTNLSAILNNGIYWRIVNIGYTLDGGITFVPVKEVRHNDWYAFLDNYFKIPTDTNPKYKETYTDFQILPNNSAASLYFTILKYPAIMDIDGALNTDLPDSIHDKIVAIALELAGLGTRDEMLVAVSKINKG